MNKKLIPLLSIFGVIAVMILVTSFVQNDFSFMFIMMKGMAYFFLVFGLFKLVNLNGFAKAYMMYDVIAKRSKAYALAYPFIEIGLGLLYLFSIGGIYRDIVTFAIMAISAYGVWKALKNGEEIQCACLGTVFKVPMTKVTLFENVFMALMALYMIGLYLLVGDMVM